MNTTGVMIGDIVTGLLMHSAPLSAADVHAVLDLMPGERVLSWERPVPAAVSPDLVRAVACPVRTTSGRNAHGVGTLHCRARVTGGRVVQTSTRGLLVPATADRRLPWSHYMAAPGTIEVLGWRDSTDLADGFIDDVASGPHLQPAVVSESALVRIQASAALDRKPAFRARRTRLRWSAVIGESRAQTLGEFVLVDDALRTLRIVLPATGDVRLREIVALCEDIALHDWLLTTVALISNRLGTDSDAAAVHRLHPAVDHLLHLWMPGGTLPPPMSNLRAKLDTDLGLTRQWRVCVDRIRDFMSLRTLELMTSRSNKAQRSHRSSD